MNLQQMKQDEIAAYEKQSKFKPGQMCIGVVLAILALIIFCTNDMLTTYNMFFWEYTFPTFAFFIFFFAALYAFFFIINAMPDEEALKKAEKIRRMSDNEYKLHAGVNGVKVARGLFKLFGIGS